MRKKIYIPISIILLTLIFIVYSESVSDSTLTALKNCYYNIIPSIFPFMVISSMIIHSGAADILGKLIPISKLFSLPPIASTPIIIGAVCGFPLGAKAAAELYEKGCLSKTETEVLISLSNNTGPSFLIFVIGLKYWGNINFGIYLYISQIIYSMISSLIINNIFLPIKNKTNKINKTVEVKSFTESLSKSITSATISSLNVCGFITFFTVISSIISKLFNFLPLKINLLTISLLEFSFTSLAASNSKCIYSVFICAFAIGWSGLSVFCQTVSFTSPLGLSLKRCVLTKFLQGIFMGISSVIYILLDSTPPVILNNSPYNIITLILITSLLTTIILLYGFYAIKKRKDA